MQALVKDTPPGELDAVRRDIATITNKNAGVCSQTDEAALKHLVATITPVTSLNTVLSKYNQAEPGSKTFVSRNVEFEFDLDDGPSKTGTRDYTASPLAEKLETYTKDHYANGVCDVFEKDDGSQVALVVGLRLSPENFFSGQWTGEYVIKGTSVTGSITVDAHYYEEGNVRLKTNHTFQEDADSANGVVEVIARAENAYQAKLNQTLASLNESAFKQLRRQLPVTRSQMVWGKASANYKLGRELNK